VGELSYLGRMLVAFGILLVVAGLLVGAVGKVAGGRVPRLPGDILIQRGNTVFYFPIVTSLLLSLILTLLLTLFFRRP